MRENKIAIGLIILVIVIIGIAVGLYSYAVNNKSQILTATLDVKSQSFVVTSKKLAGVDIWIIPTGSNIKESDYQKLTSMNLKSSDKDNQMWTAHVPTQPFLASSIFVKGYDDEENVVGTKTFPYTGATEIYNTFNQFWTPVLPAATTTKTKTTR